MLKDRKTKIQTISFALIMLLAIALRVIYWLQVKDEAWFIHPGMDPEFYLDWAKDILQSNAGKYIPFPRAPLYPYILAGLLRLFDEGWLIPRLLNLIADVASLVFICLTGKKIGDFQTGIIAALAFALTGASIYFSGEILMTALATASTAVLLYILVLYHQNSKLIYNILSGSVLAIFTLFRPNAILLLPFTALIIFTNQKLSKSISKRIVLTILHLATFLIISLPIVISNWQASGTFIPVSTQGGINFYIGNAHTANGWSSELPGVGANWTEADAQNIAKRDAHRKLTSTQVSRHFWKMGWREIKADPCKWLILELKKTLLLVNIREIGNNRPMLLATEASSLLKILILISLGTIFPFTLLGFLHHSKQGAVGILTGFIIIFAVSLLFFFINTRYRMPLLPAFLILGSLGVQVVWNDIRQRKIKILTITTLILGFVIAVPTWFGNDFNNRAQALYVKGNALLRTGDAMAAIKVYREAETINTNHPELHLNMGVALLAIGDTISAESQFYKELQIYPNNAKSENNLGTISEYRGDLTAARDHYLKAYRLNRFLEDARVNSVRILLKLGDREFQKELLQNAYLFYQEAAEIGLNDPRPIHRLALIAVANGEWEKARGLLDDALEISPDYQPAVEMMKMIVNAGF